MAHIRLNGKVADEYPIYTGESSDNRPFTYLPCAFSSFLRTDAAGVVKILVEHDREKQLRTAGVRSWTYHADNRLELTVKLDTSCPFTAGAAIAVECGWLPGLSAGVTMLQSYVNQNTRHCTEASIDEVSLVASPAGWQSYVYSVNNKTPATVKRWPTCPVQTVILKRFLTDAGITPDIAPTAAIPMPANRLISLPARSAADQPLSPAILTHVRRHLAETGGAYVPVP